MTELQEQKEKEHDETTTTKTCTSFHEIKQKMYKDQAIYFLNAYKDNYNLEKCEAVWQMHKKCAELDDLKEDGNCLSNEVSAHRVLEYSGSPATTTDLRNFLMQVNGETHQACSQRGGRGGCEGEGEEHKQDQQPEEEEEREQREQPQRHQRGGGEESFTAISLIEILLFYFKEDWRQISNAPPCYNKAKTEKAQNALLEAKKKLETAIHAEQTSRADAQSSEAAEESAAREQEESSKAAELSRREEMMLIVAKEKAESALKDVQNQEEKANTKIKELEDIASNDALGIVKRNRAKAELAQIRNEDPLPLRTAKIQNEAAVRRLAKATKSARQAAIAAEHAKKKAKESKICAKEAKLKALEAAQKAEAAIPQARIAFDDLKEMVRDLMKYQKVPQGTLFYINREVKESSKFLPAAKQRELEEAADNAKKDYAPPENIINLL